MKLRPDAAPLVIGWGPSAARSSNAWPLHVEWPLMWAHLRGLVHHIIEIDECGTYRKTYGGRPIPPDLAACPVLALALWSLKAETVRAQRARGFRLVGRVDDNFWEMPPWRVSRPSAENLRHTEAVLSEFDLIAVTTAALAEVVAPHARAVTIIQNALPVDRLPLARPNPSPTIRIGWGGSPTPEGDWAAVRGPIEALLARRRDVRLVILGGAATAPSWLVGHARVELHGWVPFDRYYQRLADLQLDLAIAPLANVVFNQSKSSLKALDFGALGLPLVASKVGPYRDLPDGQTCLLVPDNDPEAWLAALDCLIESPERRRAMGQAARAWVETHGSLHQTGPQWAEALGLPEPAVR